MKLRIVKHVCADGVERGILEYRNHWWEKWKPLHQEGKKKLDKVVSGRVFKEQINMNDIHEVCTLYGVEDLVRKECYNKVVEYSIRKHHA